MNNRITKLKYMAVIVVMLFSITACDTDDGPLENAGKNIDKAATDMGNKIEDACEDLKEGVNAKDTRC